MSKDLTVALVQLADLLRQGAGEVTVLYTWSGAPAKVLAPNGKWMYFVGDDTVTKSAYKTAVACQPAAKLPANPDARKPPSPAAEKPADPAPTRMNFWKSGDASFWVDGKRVALEDFVLHFVPSYEPNKEFTVGGRTFWINRVSPKYSVYMLDGKTERKAEFLTALNKALLGCDMVVDDAPIKPTEGSALVV